MLRVVVVGISHNTAPVEVRERFTFTEEETSAAVAELREMPGIEECMVLSTCNRTEIYAASENADDCLESVKRYLSHSSGADSNDISPYIYTSVGHMAVRHLYKVACGIDSMVLGEPQILGQVKSAYRNAVVRNTAGLILNRLCHSAFFAAKRVRTETGIGSRAVSVSYVAVELAKRIFDDLSSRKVMLVGTGEMAELAARNLVSAGIGDLVITSRSFDNATGLAGRLKGNPVRFEEIYYHLKDMDIVITATGSSDFIIKTSHAKESLKLRNNEPVFMIDIAVPRDIDPRVQELTDIYLYDIDDLKGVLDDNIKTRKESAVKADEIVKEVERAFDAWISGLKAVPAIIDLKNRFETIKDLEVQRALSKLDGFTEKDRDVIEAMAARIVGKLLHSPLTKLKEEASTSMGALYVDSLKKLFELDNELLLIDEEEDEAYSQDWN